MPIKIILDTPDSNLVSEDVRLLKALLSDHDLEVLSTTNASESIIFEVSGDQQEVEEILIETRLPWSFG